MTKQSKTNSTITNPSKLDLFELNYELDIDWKSIRMNTRKHKAAK